MGIPDHLTCLLRKLNAGQKATVRTEHGTTDWFKIGKDCTKAVHFCRVYLTLMQNTLREIRGWMNHKWESRLPEEIAITSDTQMTLPSYGRKQKTKEPLD